MEDELISRIRQEFPSITFSDVKVLDKGEVYKILLLDNTWAFRFPRDPKDLKPFIQERTILAELQKQETLPTPKYEYVSKSGDFGGYRLIQGSELTVDRFMLLLAEVQSVVASELAQFLSTLHSLPISLVRNEDSSWRPSDEDVVADYQHKYRAILEGAVTTDLLKQLDTFYSEYPKVITGKNTAVVHGDLTDDHIFLTPEENHIAGIIDFGDVAIGDPAGDFTFMWAYGEPFVLSVYEQYFDHGDPELLKRSRWSYMRWASKHLALLIEENDIQPQSWVTNQLNLHLPQILKVL